MVRRRMMFSKIISQISTTLVPSDVKLFLSDAVFDPIISHVECFGQLSSHGAGEDAMGS